MNFLKNQTLLDNRSHASERTSTPFVCFFKLGPDVITDGRVIITPSV